jgi:hypothetical protein
MFTAIQVAKHADHPIISREVNLANTEPSLENRSKILESKKIPQLCLQAVWLRTGCQTRFELALD